MSDMVITSRVGRLPVELPKGVEATLAGNELHIKGPKGKKTVAIHPTLAVNIAGQELTVVPTAVKAYTRNGTGSRLNRAIAGTMRALIANAVHGVTHAFERKLLLVGVGYRAAIKGQELNLTLGFSHPVSFVAPEGITIETPSQTEVVIKGMDLHLVGHVASCIRAIRPPEPYKGKGVRYSNEVIELKETKKK